MKIKNLEGLVKNVGELFRYSVFYLLTQKKNTWYFSSFFHFYRYPRETYSNTACYEPNAVWNND